MNEQDKKFKAVFLVGTVVCIISDTLNEASLTIFGWWFYLLSCLRVRALWPSI